VDLELFRNKTLDSANATDLLQDAINLSIVTFSTTEEAAKALSNTIGEFGLKASDVGRTSKLLFAGVTAGRVDLKDIENVLGGTSIAANQLGVSLEEVIASFVSLRDQGVPAGKATATLNLLFNRLVQSTPELNAVFGKLGFESAQAAVRALGLEGALKVISEEAKNGAGRVKAFGDALLGSDPNISKISASLGNLEKDVKRFDSALEQVNNSQQRRFEKAAASFRGGLTTIADASKKLVVIYVEGIDAVVKFLTRFEESKVGEAVAKQIKDIKAAQEETTTSAERENKKTLESYEGLFANIRKNALDTLSELRNRFQNNSVLVEENFKTLSELVKKISTDANNTIKQAQRDIVSFAQDIEKRSFEKRIQILPPAQQFQELQERLNSLIAAGEEFARQNKRQEAQGAFKEAESILLKFEDINNKIAQQQGNIARATDRNFRQHLINIDKVLGSQSKLGRENQRDLEQQLNTLRRYAQAYNEPAVRANALAEIAARQLALRQRTALQGLQQDQAALSRNAIDTEKRVQVTEDTGIRRIKGLQEQQKTLQDQLSQQRLKVTEIPKDIDTQLESLRKAGPSLQGAFDKPFQRLIDRSKEALQTFTETPNEVTFKQLGNAIDDVLNRFAKHPRITKEFQDNIDAIRTSLTGLSGGRESVSELNNKLAVVNEQLSEARTQAPIASGEIARSFESAAFSSKNLIDNVVGFNSALSESIQKVDQLTLKLSALGTIAPTVPNIQFPTVAPTAPPVEYFGRQHGGLIGGNPGIDNNLVKVSRGEYIVNADSTKRFYSQLVAMNTGRLPGFQHGGLVSNTTVGNITVNVTAQSTEQANIRQIGQALNREIRRGTLRFGG
jgi:ribosomal protein L19